MKHIIFILFLVAMGFTCAAQNDTKLKNVEKLATSLSNDIIDPMSATNDALKDSIAYIQAKIDKLSSRKYTSASSAKDSSQLAEFLNDYLLSDLFEADTKGIVTNEISKRKDSELKEAYLLILVMNKSLNEPYDKATNDKFINKATNIKNVVLSGHQPEFDKLVEHINNYEFYMFELARLFEAAKSDNFKHSVEQLVKDEDAPYLMEVPYTSRMLDTFVKNKGKLAPEQIAELKKSCPLAFEDFKFD